LNNPNFQSLENYWNISASALQTSRWVLWEGVSSNSADRAEIVK